MKCPFCQQKCDPQSPVDTISRRRFLCYNREAHHDFDVAITVEHGKKYYFSFTKPFVRYAVMQAIESGKLKYWVHDRNSRENSFGIELNGEIDDYDLIMNQILKFEKLKIFK